MNKKRKILELLLQVESKAHRLQLFRPKLKCLIGLSGGQDSICLAMFLRSFQRKWDLEFDLVYCQHGWQQDSFYNVLHITKYAVYTQAGYFIFLNPKEYHSSEFHEKVTLL